ncbi:MAG: hypothetical protein NVSMB1_20650 [Polyangiales bacterium]
MPRAGLHEAIAAPIPNALHALHEENALNAVDPLRDALEHFVINVRRSARRSTRLRIVISVSEATLTREDTWFARV